MIRPDTDVIFSRIECAWRERLIVEFDLDGTYVLTADDLEETKKVKLFERFIKDFKKVIEETNSS